MHHAHGLESDRGETALIHGADIRNGFLLEVLAEVKIFSRIQYRSKGLLHVLIGDLTVFINVEGVKYLAKLLFSRLESPVIAEILKLPGLDLARLAQV